MKSIEHDKLFLSQAANTAFLKGIFCKDEFLSVAGIRVLRISKSQGSYCTLRGVHVELQDT